MVKKTLPKPRRFECSGHVCVCCLFDWYPDLERRNISTLNYGFEIYGFAKNVWLTEFVEGRSLTVIFVREVAVGDFFNISHGFHVWYIYLHLP